MQHSCLVFVCLLLNMHLCKPYCILYLMIHSKSGWNNNLFSVCSPLHVKQMHMQNSVTDFPILLNFYFAAFLNVQRSFPYFGTFSPKCSYLVISFWSILTVARLYNLHCCLKHNMNLATKTRFIALINTNFIFTIWFICGISHPVHSNEMFKLLSFNAAFSVSLYTCLFPFSVQ